MDLDLAVGGCGDGEQRVHLGDGSPDGGGSLPFPMPEQLVRFFGEFLGAAEMLWSGH